MTTRVHNGRYAGVTPLDPHLCSANGGAHDCMPLHALKATCLANGRTGLLAVPHLFLLSGILSGSYSRIESS